MTHINIGSPFEVTNRHRPAVEFLVRQSIENLGVERILADDPDDKWLRCVAEGRWRPFGEPRKVEEKCRFDFVFPRAAVLSESGVRKHSGKQSGKRSCCYQPR